MKETSTKPPETVEYGWHFVSDRRRLEHGDGREVRQGETLAMPEPQAVGDWTRPPPLPLLCYSGMHASWIASDALEHAPGSIICRVAVWGEIDTGISKFCGKKRHVIWMLPLEKSREVLLAHGRWLETCLTQVIGPFRRQDADTHYIDGLKGQPHAYARACWHQVDTAIWLYYHDSHDFYETIEHYAARNARDWDLEDRAIEAAKECGVFVEDYDPTAMTAAAQE